MSGSLEQYPDVKSVRALARKEWEQRIKRSLSVQERIGQSVPWWLVIVAGVFFLLSMPHTAEVFNRLTPGWGKVAPLGVEFGLLYGAFRRKQSQGNAEGIPAMLWLLEGLLFITAIIVNGAGAFTAVVESSARLHDLPFSDLLREFPTLPATSQVALILAPISALIIPIGTVVAGEGLAKLFLERQEVGNLLEMRWSAEGALIEFEALRDAALANGITPGKATKWAESIAYIERPQLSVVSAADESGQSRTFSGRAVIPPTDSAGHGTGQGYSKQMNAREVVWAHLSARPEDAHKAVRALAADLGVGKTTVADVLAEFRAAQTGHEE